MARHAGLWRFGVPIFGTDHSAKFMTILRGGVVVFL